jgi:hypothetical protein
VARSSSRIAVVVFALPIAACASAVESGATKGATHFITVEAHRQLDRGSFSDGHYQDENGVRVNGPGKPDLGFCVEKCGFALTQGQRILGCHAARPEEEVVRTISLGRSGDSGETTALLVCELP